MRYATASRPIFLSAAPISESFRPYSERRHTAREQQAEARITYRFHPRFGETVRIRRRLESSGVEFIVVHQPDGSFACLPAWMTHDTASRFEIGMAPAFSLTTLRARRNEVDALLGLLASESPTERAEHDAPIQKSPAKPLRGGAAARRVAAQAKGRTRGNRGGTAARDRGGAGKGAKWGERR